MAGLSSLTDYALAFFKSIVDGAGPTLFGTINTNVTNGLPAVQQTTDQSAFGGDVAAPSAGGVIATTTLAAGTYDVFLYTNLSGTTAGLDRPNLAFNVGGVQKMVILSTLGGITDPSNIRITVGAATTINVTAIATSTAGSVYRAVINARRVA